MIEVQLCESLAVNKPEKPDKGSNLRRNEIAWFYTTPTLYFIFYKLLDMLYCSPHIFQMCYVVTNFI